MSWAWQPIPQVIQAPAGIPDPVRPLVTLLVGNAILMAALTPDIVLRAAVATDSPLIGVLS